MQTKTSLQLFQHAQKIIPGGVNSPVRAFKGVALTEADYPIIFNSAEDAYLFDADNQQYIDYVCSWGAIITGHAHPRVIKAVQAAAEKGLSFGTSTAAEIEFAEKITRLMPSMEMVRQVTSGTEATMTAIRLARGYTGRNKIIKFAGCYHGHSDSLLVQAGSGPLTLGVPSSAGVPAAFTEHTLIATFNDLDSVEKLFDRYGSDIAAVIIEPVAGNMNCILPEDGFLSGLREICTQQQSLLIFDEVMCGFRVGLGGAQALYKVKPDLTTIGKVIGGGLPIGALGGSKKIMECLAPAGPVYQAGTLSGNPIATAAGLATLELISAPDFYTQLGHNTQQLMAGLQECAAAAGIPCTTVSIGGMFGFFFSDQEKISNLEDVQHCDITLFKKFYREMLNQGIYFAPSAFEAGFMSSAHTERDIQQTLNACEAALQTIRKL